MNAEVFNAICARLGEIAELKYVDFDEGQLNIAGERPPVAFPCCLIDIAYSDCKDLDEEEQLITAAVTIKLGFVPMGETRVGVPEAIKTRALTVFNTIGKVHDSLQGFTGNDLFSPMSRKRATPSTRADKVKVYTIVYNTTFREDVE